METNLHSMFGEIFSDFIRPVDHVRQTKCTVIQDIDRAWYLVKGKHLSPKQFDYLYELSLEQLYEVQNNVNHLVLNTVQSHP